MLRLSAGRASSDARQPIGVASADASLTSVSDDPTSAGAETFNLWDGTGQVGTTIHHVGELGDICQNPSEDLASRVSY